MTRYDLIKSMSIDEMARQIIKLNITDEFCDSACGNEEECLHDVECCIKWLKSDKEMDCPNCSEKVIPCLTCWDETHRAQRLKAECEADPKEKGPQELSLQADPSGITSRVIISQNPNYKRGFIGSVHVFRQYLKADRILLNVGMFSP